MADLVEVMKLAALSAVDASYPVTLFFGTVTSEDPLVIVVEQKMTLKAEQLILAREVTEHWIEMTVDHFTEDETEHTHAVHDTYTGGGSSDPTAHKHAYKGRKRFLVHKGLVTGERVILLREQGGQRFLVLDRVGVTP